MTLRQVVQNPEWDEMHPVAAKEYVFRSRTVTLPPGIDVPVWAVVSEGAPDAVGLLAAFTGAELRAMLEAK